MKTFLFSAIVVLFVLSAFNKKERPNDTIIGSGQMPAIAMDASNKFHLVYGTGDSIMYSQSADGGAQFSAPTLIALLPHLAASHTRGPQIAVTADGLLVTACTSEGNIFSFKMTGGKWRKTARVNDVDTIAKENLMALAADGKKAVAVWLDLRNNKRNKIVGAFSSDGGNTWSKNKLVYASPDTTVCQCCKPSVAVRGKNVYVMFRNWLKGNRDLYLIQSNDGGKDFGEAQKLGNGSWALNGCPMDGGGLALNKAGNPQTVWNRKGIIYTCAPAQEEREIGRGRSCTIASVNDKNAYAWMENGDVMVAKPDGSKINLGKGQLPVIKATNKNLLCVWENDKQIHTASLPL